MSQARASVVGLIPARGGSKSIPYKNLVEIAGKPLIDYVIDAAQQSTVLSRIICSTEDERIKRHVEARGVEVDRRPDSLAGDDALVTDVACELLARWHPMPDAVVLLQPTSPFILPAHIDDLVTALLSDETAASAQTVIPCPHNAHAINQRRLNAGIVSFVFEAERLQAYNKQRKPKHFLFGNLLAAKTAPLLRSRNFFVSPSLGREIPRVYGFDVDDLDDVHIAGALISSGVLRRPAQV